MITRDIKLARKKKKAILNALRSELPLLYPLLRKKYSGQELASFLYYRNHPNLVIREIEEHESNYEHAQ